MVSSGNGTTPPPSHKARVSDSEMRLRQLLKSSPQSLWLETMRRTKGPRHDSLVYWMLNQIECDFAVAVHAFYRSNPVQFVKTAKPLPMRPGTSDLFAVTLVNWDTGSYRLHRLALGPEDAPPQVIARMKQKLMAYPRGFLPFKIPQRFLEPTGGDVVKLPNHQSPEDAPHIWALFHELGLKVDPAPPGLARKIARARSMVNWIAAGRKQA